MNTSATVRSSLVALMLLTGLALPYAAPTVCELLGRMGSDMQMVDGVATVQAPQDGHHCCDLTDCGVFQIAVSIPLLSDLHPTRVSGVSHGGLPLIPPSLSPLPSTPPPQA